MGILRDRSIDHYDYDLLFDLDHEQSSEAENASGADGRSDMGGTIGLRSIRSVCGVRGALIGLSTGCTGS